jgi:hypothetical protein
MNGETEGFVISVLEGSQVFEISSQDVTLK